MAVDSDIGTWMTWMQMCLIIHIMKQNCILSAVKKTINTVLALARLKEI